MISYLLILPVAIVFLISGIVKVIDSGSFISHIAKLGFLNKKNYLVLPLLLIGMEVALGTSILLFFAPHILIPLTIILLLFFIGLTYWSTKTGKVEDCGCYGGLLAIKPKTSMILDVIYILLLLGALLILDFNNFNTPIFSDFNIFDLLKLVLILASFAAAYYYSKKSTKEPLMDISRLKNGVKWKSGWLKSDIIKITKEQQYFVVFLGKTCPYCKRWVPLLNIMNTQKDLPKVFGIMTLSNEEIEQFKTEYLVRFPLVYMDKLLWNTMIKAVPTAIHIKEGVIQEKWTGKLPEEYAERIKIFLESIAPAKQEKKAFGG
jgi:thioredoxin-related protein